jgi:UTP-glucose-1-phosphate uridylyltransferase
MPSRFINASRFILTPLVIEELEKQIPGKDNEIWLTDAENRLMQKGELFIAPTWEGYDWYQVGDPVGWLKANIALARMDDRFKDKIDAALK